LAEIFIDANHIHPSQEGNGRSLQVFMKELAREQDIEDVKREMPEVQQAALAKFDRAAENPAFVERLEKSDQAQETTKEPEQRQARKDTHEQSL
jgi:fido (protein-threonine AMPylation protein)